MITLYHATYNKFKESILKEGLRVASKDGFLSYGEDFYIGSYIYLADTDDLALSFRDCAIDENDSKEAQEAYNSGFIIFKVELPNDFELYFDENNKSNYDLLEQLNEEFCNSNIEEQEMYEDIEMMPINVLIKVAKELNIYGFTFMTPNNISPEYLTEI